MSNFDKFVDLHKQKNTFILGNIHDINSAIVLEKLGYKAIGTSSFAIAHSMGLEDGENIDFSILLNLVKNITQKINIPLTIDMESGYNKDITQVCKNIKCLAELGVIGINIEDSIVENNNRNIQKTENFAKNITTIKQFLNKEGIEIFLNIRTDYYIMNLDNALENTLSRIRLYEKAGADGIFVPFVKDKQDIIEIVNSTKLPINIMIVPGIPDLDTLNQIGVKRISMGPTPYLKTIGKFEENMQNILTTQSFSSIL